MCHSTIINTTDQVTLKQVVLLSFDVFRWSILLSLTLVLEGEAIRAVISATILETCGATAASTKRVE